MFFGLLSRDKLSRGGNQTCNPSKPTFTNNNDPFSVCFYQFVNDHLETELSSIVEDVLSAYKFEKTQDAGLGNVYRNDEVGIKNNTLSLKEILLNSYLGKSQTIAKVAIENNVFFFDSSSCHNKILVNGRYFHLKPIITVDFLPIMKPSAIMIIRKLIYNLYNIYEKMQRHDQLDRMRIVKMHDFNALFTKITTIEQNKINQNNVNEVKNHFQDIFDKGGGIIDSRDELSLMSDGRNTADFFKAKVEFIYNELSRFLKVPLTRLLGYAPSGFASTGEHDSENYQMTLNRMRIGYLEPFLDLMGIDYKKVSDYDLEKIKKIAEIHTIAGVYPDGKFRHKIEELGQDF